jgi:hypothetical protein
VALEVFELAIIGTDDGERRFETESQSRGHLYVPVARLLSLSTTWSTWSLIGRPHLEVGFSLRCFQRLSVPYMATGLCSWQNNPHTRGTSIQVLSYYG